MKRHLMPLSATEVVNYLDSVFTYITSELQNSIWQASGGVPLYLFNLLKHLASEKIIEDNGDGRWKIAKPSTFRRLASTGLRSDGVLIERLKAVDWNEIHFHENFYESPLVLVALLAIAKEPQRVKKLCELAGIDLNIYHSVRRNLIRFDIIRQDDDEWAINFQHDLMNRMAIELGRDSNHAHKIVSRILTGFQDSTESILDLELHADLAAWIGLKEEAVRSLNAAFERLQTGDNFTALHRILTNLCQILESDAFSSARNYTRYLASRSALAWATWNVGSLYEAQSEFSRVSADALAGADSLIEPSTAEAYAADAERRVLGIHLELEDIPAFTKSAEHCVKLKSDVVAFNSMMNRLVLYCARFNHVELGMEFSKLALEAFGDPAPESSAAVICSDIGTLFRSSAPVDALDLYWQGVRLVADERQRIYNEIDIIITEFVVGGKVPSAEILDIRRNQLVQKDLRAMVCRLDLFRAFLDLRDGDLSAARKLYRHLETSISVYQYENFRLAILNDSMITALLDEDFSEVDKLQTEILRKVKQSFRHRNTAATKMAALVPQIVEKKKRFTHLAALDIKVPIRKPAFSGVPALALLNLYALGKSKRGIKRGKLAEAIKLWDGDEAARTTAQAAFERLPAQCGIDIGGISLISSAQ